MNKRSHKSLSTFLVAIITLSMAMIAIPVKAQYPDYFSVDPPYFNASDVGLTECDSFTIDINVTAVTALFGYEFKLYWERELLNCTAAVDSPPFSSAFCAGPGIEWDHNATHGRYFKGCTSLAETFTGDATIATLTFHIEYQPTDPPDPTGRSCPLDLDDTKFSDAGGDPVPHDEYDGLYEIESIPIPWPHLYLDPPEVYGICGDLVTVDLRISGLHSSWNLFGWEAQLKYNTSLLDTIDIEIGPFMGGFAGAGGTFNVTKFGLDYDGPPDPPWNYEEAGNMVMGEAFLGMPASWPSGSGLLATITFNCTYQSLFPIDPIVDDVLDLDRTKLADVQAQPISHTHDDAIYHAPYKTLGRGIDCYTDSYRKHCETPFTGEGINATADAYAPQDVVTLYALVTYNEDPVQNKIVEFEIWGPRNPYLNISIYRTAITNAFGIAMINFTVPVVCEPFTFEQSLEIIFGEWVCYQAVDIKCEKVEDWLWFKVGWAIELTDILVEPDRVTKCNYIDVTVYFKNIMLISKHVVLTMVIYDELINPIVWVVMPCIQVPAAPRYCTVYEDYYTFTVHIPKWSLVGIATVYVNAFTDMPMDCGIPYCPELSGTFSIIRAE